MKTRIAIVTYDLLPGRERLMPWRTMLEVVRKMRKIGHDAWLISINRGVKHSYASHDFDTPVWFCSRVSDLQPDENNKNGSVFSPELVYWPIAWRSGVRSEYHWHGWNCPTVVYHDGCCYSFSHVLAAIRYMPLLQLKALLVETFIPKRFLVRKLHRKRVSGVICMTESTRHAFIKAGWPKERSVVIPPGMTPEKEIVKDVLCAENLDYICQGQPYVLFLGNPLPIRGTDALISAARKVFAQSKNAKIVCLLRPDPGEEMKTARERILQKVKEQGIDRQFVCITRKLASHEVRQSIKNARAVVMPFLFVPSEIPLGVLEAMQLGTPVIITRSGGTSEYVGDGGWIVPPGNVISLAKAIISALHNDETRREKAAICLEKMASHPTWDTVGDAWLEFGFSMSERLAT